MAARVSVCVCMCVCVFVFYFENYFWLNKRCKFLAVSLVWLLVSGHLRHIVIAIWLLAIFGAKFFYYIQIKLLHSFPTLPPPHLPSPAIWIKKLLLQATCGCVCVCVVYCATLDCDACLKVAAARFVIQLLLLKIWNLCVVYKAYIYRIYLVYIWYFFVVLLILYISIA